MTIQSPNKEDLTNLIENYAWHIVEGLDHKSADQMLFDLLTREYEKMTWDEVTEEIVDLYDEDTLIDLPPQGDSWGSGTGGVVIAPRSCIVVHVGGNETRSLSPHLKPILFSHA